jgi:hypothetical protein
MIKFLEKGKYSFYLLGKSDCAKLYGRRNWEEGDE